jgi:ferrous iron transport protein B
MVIPNRYVWGVFNLQGLMLMVLYLSGFIAALGAAWVMRLFIKVKERSYFIMELPIYRAPRWSNIGISIIEKIKLFLFDAGKVIIAISIILWLLSSFGPGDKFKQIEQKYALVKTSTTMQVNEHKQTMQSEKLEASYAGVLGHWMEPAIKPLGFDWKIGIALVTSFAAREVFVGTMATIYTVGNDSQLSVREKMMAEKDPETGLPRYTLAVGLSLMFFYVFAMQCMSTLAVVYRETRNWRWPVIQVLYMSGLAYLSSLIIYQLLK